MAHGNGTSVPSMKPFGGFSLLTFVAVLLAGCGGSESVEEHADNTPAASSATPSKRVSTVSTQTSVCKDKRGDGGPMDLVRASLRTGDSVLVTAVLAAPIPKDDTVRVGVLAQSRTDHVSLLLGWWVNGRASEHYVEKVSGVSGRRTTFRCQESRPTADE